jgi:spore coat polysaccharide biosynthesis protein SpsF
MSTYNDTCDGVRVLIAIQARSNSTRFPEKIFQTIGNKMVLQHVIDKAMSTKNHVERTSGGRRVIYCDVAVLYPMGDSQIFQTFRRNGIDFFAGSELDVLSRFCQACDHFDSDYVVRLTSDCPLMLDYVITKHINIAVHRALDYVSNVEETCRQVADGFDCEILSRRALEWLHDNAITDEDKEHVTTAIRRERPQELKQGFIAMKLDTSHMKMSLDTPEDLEVIRQYHAEREKKMIEATRLFGRTNVFEM